MMEWWNASKYIFKYTDKFIMKDGLLYHRINKFRLLSKKVWTVSTFCFAVSASLQAELYMSIVCLSSSLSLRISDSMSSYKVWMKHALYLCFLSTLMWTILSYMSVCLTFALMFIVCLPVNLPSSHDSQNFCLLWMIMFL
jgi:hypothetical protein